MAQPKIRPNQLYTVLDPTVNGDTNKVLVDEFKSFTPGVASPAPQSFRENSLSGFEAYNSTDFPPNTLQGQPQFYSGITVNGPGGVRSMQLAVCWDTEANRPIDMFVRVNDDTGVTTSWSPWNRIRLGNTTFTTSTATPTGGLPGDVVYVY